MTAGDLIPTLALVTLGVVLAVGIWRFVKIDKKVDD